jgi:tRNA-modifying protein YgfZ
VNPTSQHSFFVYHPAACLRVSGEDAETFLQGQFTNDLRPATDRAVYGLWLNQKGKVLADSFVLRDPRRQESWVFSYFSPEAVIRERLDAYVIADDISIEGAMTPLFAGISVIGAGAEAWLTENCSYNRESGWLFAGRRCREENVEWIFPRERLAAVKARLARAGAGELSAGDIDRLRIEAEIPAVPVDIGLADLPNEGGLEADAISYTKGCYLGQEVMARLKSLGQVRRRLLRVGGSMAEMPALPATLFAGAKKAGELRSAVADGKGGFVGLAMLSLLQVQAETALTFAPDGAPTVRLLVRS